MSNHKRRALVHDLLDRLLYQMLALGIDLTRRFVQNENRTGPVNRTRDAKPLLLPSRKLRSLAPQKRVISLRLLQNKIVRERALRRIDRALPVRPRIAVGDV